MTLTTKAQELRKQADKIEILAEICDKLNEQVKWECMDYHDADEEHDETWFTAPEIPEDGDYDTYDGRKRLRYETYQEVLTAIEKLAK